MNVVNGLEESPYLWNERFRVCFLQILREQTDGDSSASVGMTLPFKKNILWCPPRNPTFRLPNGWCGRSMLRPDLTGSNILINAIPLNAIPPPWGLIALQ